MSFLDTYAAYCKDNSLRKNSSSGGVFSLLAEFVLKQQGVVYGVSMSQDCYFAEFISVRKCEDLTKLRGSKYLQAKIGNTYRNVKNDLISGKFVLFSGTGCQINGLKNYLGKQYDNLICVDVICHGVPSPALWRKYVEYQENNNGGKLKSINFRCKNCNWTDFGMKETLDTFEGNESKKLYISKDKDAYMQMFLKNYSLRPSCYECVAKKVKLSDLTIADFWGIDAVAPDMNDGMGTSLVIIRTDKGKDIFKKISSNIKFKKVSYEDGVRKNPSEYQSCCKPMLRDTFFDDMYCMSFEELEKKYISFDNMRLVNRVKRKIKRGIVAVLRKISGGAEHNYDNNYCLLFVFDSQS